MSKKPTMPAALRLFSSALLPTLLTLAFAGPAHAGTYPMYQCSANAPSIADGWETVTETTQAIAILSNKCSSGGLLGDYVYTNGQAGAVTENGSNGSTVGLYLSVPNGYPGIDMRSLTADVYGSSATGNKAYLGFQADGDLLSLLELPGSGVYSNQSTWALPQGTRGFLLSVFCSTSGSSPTCTFPDDNSVPAMNEITLTLEDDTPPSISAVSGELVTAAASTTSVTGTQALGFTASDPDSGVLSSTLTFTPRAGGEPTTHIFDFSSQCAYDSWNACPLKQTIGGYTFETATLKDGSYTVELTAKNAAGDTSSYPLGTVTTSNAPLASTPPTILAAGGVSVGSQLTSQPGNWSAPAAAGTITYAYQWQDCSSTGTECQSIPGASEAAYTTTASDVGHTLRVQVTARDNDGTSTSTSSPSSTVAAAQGSQGAPNGPGSGGGGTGGGGAGSESKGTQAPNPPASGNPAQGEPATSALPAMTSGSNLGAGQPNGIDASVAAALHLGIHTRITHSYEHRAFELPGLLTTAQGQPIAGARLEIREQAQGSTTTRLIAWATTRDDGTFTAVLPAGPSRQIQVLYRAYSGEAGDAVRATVSESVSAGVTLSISSRRTSRTGTIVLSGQVLGQVPRNGVVVELLVHYRGRWQPFRDPRTHRNGRFHIAYQFQGAHGHFPFRVQVRGSQAQFPYTLGYSHIIDVTTIG